MGLIELLLADHRKTAFGAESDYTRKEKSDYFGVNHPYSVADFCRRMAKRRLNVAPKNWGRDMSHLYLVATRVIDGMEVEALSQLFAIEEQYRGDL